MLLWGNLSFLHLRRMFPQNWEADLMCDAMAVCTLTTQSDNMLASIQPCFVLCCIMMYRGKLYMYVSILYNY